MTARRMSGGHLSTVIAARRAWLLGLALLASCRQAPAPAAPEKAKPELFLLTPEKTPNKVQYVGPAAG